MKVLIGNSNTPLVFKKSTKDDWWEAKDFIISPNLKTCHTFPWFVDSCEPPEHKFKIVQ